MGKRAGTIEAHSAALNTVARRHGHTLFPDDDHAPHSLRRARFSKLARNALPPAPTTLQKIYASPVKQHASKKQDTGKHPDGVYTTKATAESTVCANGARQAHRRRIANPCDSDLWGFPVYFSPKREIASQWELARAQTQAGMTMTNQQQEATMLPAVPSLTLQNEQETRQDYAQYLYFASSYGPLDSLLYCATSRPGKMYALLVEQCSRRLQMWLRARMYALRCYWITRLARYVNADAITQGCQAVSQSMEHQQCAMRFLNRLRWLFAAKALRNWFEYTQKQIEVRWRFQFVVSQDVRARFFRWKGHVDAVKKFKQQLKNVARRKRMAGVFSQWQEWQMKQSQARQLLVRRWLKTQRDCWAAWIASVSILKRLKRAALRIQCWWRQEVQRKRFLRTCQAAGVLGRVIRGWLARQQVHRLKDEMAIAETLIRLTRVVAWQEHCDIVHKKRESLLTYEIVRTSQEREYVEDAKSQSEEFVRTELDKVVRNSMHYRLQEQLRLLKDSGEAIDVQRHPQAMTQLATEKLVRDMRVQARDEAVRTFRSQRPENRPLTACFVCYANEELQTNDMGQFMVEGSAHVCARTSGSDLVAIGMEFDHLKVQEVEYEHQLQCQPIPIPVLWNVIKRSLC